MYTQGYCKKKNYMDSSIKSLKHNVGHKEMLKENIRIIGKEGMLSTLKQEMLNTIVLMTAE